MEEKKEYRIEVNGCDDFTIFTMRLTALEYEIVKQVVDKCNEASEYDCMPTMTITYEAV